MLLFKKIHFSACILFAKLNLKNLPDARLKNTSVRFAVMRLDSLLGRVISKTEEIVFVATQSSVQH